MINKIIIFTLFALSAIGCSRKQVPQVTLPTKIDKCDSTIQALLDSIQSVEPIAITETIYTDGITDTVCVIDSSNCNYYKVQALQLASKLHTANKEIEYFKALAQSRAKKIINNINSGNKNTQIGDANVQQIKPKSTAVIGDDNVTTVKPKQSAIGDGNTLDNSKKGNGWFWIFVGGNLCWIIVQNLLYPIAMRFIPFANVASKVKTVFKIFTS